MTKARKGTFPGWRQCNADIPGSLASALQAHLALTRVPKQDFLALAIRNEILRQRREGLGLIDGSPPAAGVSVRE